MSNYELLGDFAGGQTKVFFDRDAETIVFKSRHDDNGRERHDTIALNAEMMFQALCWLAGNNTEAHKFAVQMVKRNNLYRVQQYRSTIFGDKWDTI